MAAHLWMVYAIAASLLWGLVYVLAGRLLQHGLSVPTVLVIESGLLFLFMAPAHKALKSDFQILLNNPQLAGMAILLAICFVAANFMIATSIAEKNATLAALLEISYPIFTVFFAWLIFRDAHLTWETALGGLLIFIGVSIIYVRN